MIVESAINFDPLLASSIELRIDCWVDYGTSLDRFDFGSIVGLVRGSFCDGLNQKSHSFPRHACIVAQKNFSRHSNFCHIRVRKLKLQRAIKFISSSQQFWSHPVIQIRATKLFGHHNNFAHIQVPNYFVITAISVTSGFPNFSNFSIFSYYIFELSVSK